MSHAIVFPGQGCQYVGMAAELCQTLSEVRSLFEEADDILGFPLSDLCHSGPDDVLCDTANTQPAIYVTSVALWNLLDTALDGHRASINCMAGHSLGEFVALTAAGALSFEQGLKLVRRRGEAMREAGSSAPGGMAAIIGLSDEAVAEIITDVQTRGESVWVANYNSPGQVVIAGEAQGLATAMAMAKDRGAKRALPLAVSVACHTPLMQAAAKALGEALAATPMQIPWVPVVSNARALPLSDPEEIRVALLDQLSSPVRWVESVQQMANDGVKTFVEVGPKSVVSGLIKRIVSDAEQYSVTDLETVQDVAARFESVVA